MSVHFPDEITDKILVRLDPKSLIKFSAVCKSWRSLIKSPAFIHTHLSRTIQPNNQNDSHLLLLVTTKADTGMIYSFRWDNPEFSEYTQLIDRFADNEERSGWDLNVVGTCNGLYIARYAFGYDSRNNDYKVLGTVNLPGQTECYQAEIWSLARGSWKSLGVGSTGRGSLSELIQQPAFVNDAVHWVQLHTMKGENGIMLFDMVSESFGETRVPQRVTKMLMFVLQEYTILVLMTYG
ncbi:PREDICTED: putative F-box protein At3g16210 [Prunus mume]|uniref:F-box protein At3g16210 n=1 Tax=Prunus mume TaxID=102107 RepID=A0ABM0NME7_PRUMU|nr:PREDICTED: putative F-box protein At3g16210 [Prunus mume]